MELRKKAGEMPLIVAAIIRNDEVIVPAGSATFLMASANSLSVFIPGLLIYGLTGFVTPPMNSYATEARGKWSVARALTFISAAYNLGMVAGPFIGGRVAEGFGIDRKSVV